MIVSLPATPWFYRSLHAILLVLVAWFAAGLFWQIFSPRPLPPVAAPSKQLQRPPQLDMSALNGLFGSPSNGEPQPSTLSFKLRGVIATASPAVAVFEVPGQPALAIKTGGEVEAGVRLVEVNAEYVLLDNRGRRERMELDAKPAATIGTADTTPAGGGDSSLITAAPMEAPPAEPQTEKRFELRKENERSLHRQELVEGLQRLNVADWSRGLGEAPGGGITVQNAASQPLAAPLGLQSGDILKSVNGAPLTHVGDISALYSAFSRASQISVEIKRNGTPMNLRYRIESPTAP
ncbi:hypothetical protein FNU76_03640 [Chitinimonas arctica]|uniref:Type II secretion system protein GspC N-terminal domain-containing protein n=1 Tax=Chitinimonas arctica TaxID=2594795 RepID=A0A516SBJ9_9NEIS|nr:type II secretion system protein N [Chitinimonas arctica]QDQ25520.1 hypothetical protein FNU76_03640 [Chitinimonas arctica]